MNSEDIASIEKHKLKTNMSAFNLPLHCRNSLVDYILYHKSVGSFLRNLLSNDLQGTFATADDINSNAIKNYVLFLYNCVPGACWGSPKKVKDWLENK